MLNLLNRDYPSIDLVVLTMLDIPAVLYQISTVGVKGLIHKSDEISELGRAIQEGTRSTPYIGQSVQRLLRKGPSGKLPTVREVEVLKMYVVGIRKQA